MSMQTLADKSLYLAVKLGDTEKVKLSLCYGANPLAQKEHVSQCMQLCNPVNTHTLF